MHSSIYFLASLASLVTARTDLSGCVSSVTGASLLWYVPGTGEVCEFLDCGGGRAPPKTTVPGCAAYAGTATYSPSFLSFAASTTAAPVTSTAPSTASITPDPSTAVQTSTHSTVEETAEAPTGSVDSASVIATLSTTTLAGGQPTGFLNSSSTSTDDGLGGFAPTSTAPVAQSSNNAASSVSFNSLLGLVAAGFVYVL